jgi:adenylosuccinate synthase
VLVNCGQILEHHLLPGRLLATTTPRPRLLAWMDGSARRHAVQVAAQAQQQDQISRAG